MLKNELIEKLKAIDGNPIVSYNDAELGIVDVKDMKLCRVHESKDCPGEYVEDEDYKKSTYYQEYYKSESEDTILFLCYDKL